MRRLCLLMLATVVGCEEEPEPPPPPPLPVAHCGTPTYELLPPGSLGEVVSWQELDDFRLPALELDIIVSLAGFSALTPVSHGVRLFRFRYTTQDQGAAIEATGMIGLPQPDFEPDEPWPVALALHGFAGASDACAPSEDSLIGPAADRHPGGRRFCHGGPGLHRDERARGGIHPPARPPPGRAGRRRGVGTQSPSARPGANSPASIRKRRVLSRSSTSLIRPVASTMPVNITTPVGRVRSRVSRPWSSGSKAGSKSCHDSLSASAGNAGSRPLPASRGRRRGRACVLGAPQATTRPAWPRPRTGSIECRPPRRPLGLHSRSSPPGAAGNRVHMHVSPSLKTPR